MAIQTRRRRSTTGPTTEKLAISLPRELAERVREEAKRRGSSISALVADSLSARLECDDLQQVVDEIFDGKPMTDEERAWADQYFRRP